MIKNITSARHQGVASLSVYINVILTHLNLKKIQIDGIKNVHIINFKTVSLTIDVVVIIIIEFLCLSRLTDIRIVFQSIKHIQCSTQF